MNVTSSNLASSTMTATKPSALELRDVRKAYPGEPPLEILHGIDVVIRHGELVAIIGPSGSGKSTLLNVIGTLDRTTSGKVIVDGNDTADLNDKQLASLRAARVGFVFQQFHLLAHRSALDNVALGLLYQGLRRKERRERAAEALDRVKLSHRLDHLPGQLSGGERQRVAIARAVVAEPAILLADEPTGNLDTKTGIAVMQILNDLNQIGITIVVVTHDREVAGQFPRTIAIRDGEIESDGVLQ
jgi:putative ABC transport system ATP-binding protein